MAVPKVKITFDADFDELKRGVNGASNEVEGFSGRVNNFGKMAGAAFAAAGAAAAAYAGKLLVDGVKAAIEDEQAQVRLANALKNTVGATDGAIKSAENWILKQSLASGISDDELRPALERLTRSTKDIAEAQKLTNLAMDIAKAKNISVETAANALAKANDGQTGALKKLGITLGDNATNLQEYNKVQKTLEKAQLDANFALQEYGPKSKDYISASEKVKEAQEKANAIAAQGIDVFGELGKEFAGAAAESANTFQGKLDRLNIAFSEAKETVGSYVLDAITPMVTFIVDEGIPTLIALGSEISEKLKPIFEDLIFVFQEYLIPIFTYWFKFISEFIWPFLQKLFIPIISTLVKIFEDLTSKIVVNKGNFERYFEALKPVFEFVRDKLAPILGTVLAGAINIVGDALGAAISLVGKFAGAISTVIDKVTDLIRLIKNNPVVQNITGAIGSIFGGGRASGGSVSAGTTYLVGERGAELFTPSQNGTIIPNNALGARGGNTVNINVSGALDPVAVARQIANLLNQEATLNGTFINLGSSRLVAP